MPTVILAIGVLGLFGEEAFDSLIDLIDSVAPGELINLVEEIRGGAANNETGSLFALIFGALGGLWAASGAMGAVIKAVNRAYDRLETRPFWKVRLTAIVLVVLSATVGLGLFVFIILGGPLGEAIADAAGLGGVFELLWGILRWPIAFVALLLFFALVYYIAPNRDQRSWAWVSPGSLVAAVLLLALSSLFALYTSFADAASTYGSLAGAIIALLWLNYSAFALLFGAELNSELDRQADIRAAGGPNAGLVRPARRTR